MRNLAELKLEDASPEAVKVADLDILERHYDLTLPSEYVEFLKYSNGGGSLVGVFTPLGDPDGRESVGWWYHLSSNREETNSIWSNTDALRGIIGLQKVVIAGDPFGNQFYLDCSESPSGVYMWLHEESGSQARLKVANSFGEFVDMLEDEQDDDV